jgi:signal transduction histidine kinase
MIATTALNGHVESLPLADKQLKILHLEDLVSDALLVRNAFRKEGITYESLVVDTKDKFIEALQEFLPDIILADHSLPSFNSTEALEIFHATGTKIPFIIVTATMSEEYAVSIIKKGADDYILKDRLHRLPHAVVSAVEKYRYENERRQLKKEAREKEAVSKELLRVNAEEREVLLAQLTRSLADLQQFSYITSHNFRAPLSNLIGLLGLIDNDELSNHNKVIIDMFKTSTEQLNKTVNDLVQILIIRNNVNIDLADNDIDVLLTEVCNSLAFVIQESNCTIHRDLKVENIPFNKAYLESILINLLSNSIKYRSPDRPLHVHVATGKNDGGEIWLTFKDNGLGIDLSRHNSNMFGLYQRFHSNADGIGLGLFIVKAQIISIGGSIEVESEVDKGTMFTITFKTRT